MRLLDSNIIIYATDPENEWLRIWLEAEPFAISQISQIEVLGYHQITLEEIADLQEFLYSSNVLPVSDEAAKKAIALRQQRKMSLADSILAGTALENDLELVSRNVDDFEWIAGLRLVNPFDFRP
ncbi:MAG TPA: type II toxin-antitoxin system VapC family toxin [Chthoniobacterales bacterium]|nr:type II toxin-antitoxin system VapC family toxin [Chthoniobacterales bacterium]